MHHCFVRRPHDLEKSPYGHWPAHTNYLPGSGLTLLSIRTSRDFWGPPPKVPLAECHIKIEPAATRPTPDLRNAARAASGMKHPCPIHLMSAITLTRSICQKPTFQCEPVCQRKNLNSLQNGRLMIFIANYVTMPKVGQNTFFTMARLTPTAICISATR